MNNINTIMEIIHAVIISAITIYRQNRLCRLPM
jgi:hypothetical protein